MLLDINENIFFIPLDGTLAAWDFVRHKQFLLSVQSVRAIVDLDFRASHPQVVDDLVAANILLKAPPRPRSLWTWDILSKIFHFGTSRHKPANLDSNARQRAIEYVEYCNSIVAKMPADCFTVERGNHQVPIGETDLPELRYLSEILDLRRSNRTFSGNELTFSQIAAVVDETFRYRPHDQGAYKKMGMVTPAARRSSPSGGSLQSCEGYILCRSVTGIEAGIYHFRSHQRNLGLIGALPKECSFGELCGGQFFADDLSALIVITCRFDKLMWKYKHSHSYRVALIDAGHLSQTAQLVATALGIRTWVTAAFYDDDVRNILQIAPDSVEYPLLIVGLGTGPSNPFDVHLGNGFATEAR